MNEALNNLLYIVVTVLLPVVVTYLVKFIQSKIDNLDNATENETVNQYIKGALEAIETAVVQVNQTYVDSIKGSGKLTEETQTEAFNKAKALALTLISEEAKEAIEITFNNFETYLNAQIEKYVNENK